MDLACLELDLSRRRYPQTPAATWLFQVPELDVQCEAPKIAKLVYNFNNYGLWYL